MPNDPFATSPGLSPRHLAFVVHLAVAADRHESGRVEHLASGRASRFGSADELFRFMRETLAGLAGAGQPACEDAGRAITACAGPGHEGAIDRD